LSLTSYSSLSRARDTTRPRPRHTWPLNRHRLQRLQLLPLVMRVTGRSELSQSTSCLLLSQARIGLHFTACHFGLPSESCEGSSPSRSRVIQGHRPRD
jgi:hypothetical protein